MSPSTSTKPVVEYVVGRRGHARVTCNVCDGAWNWRRGYININININILCPAHAQSSRLPCLHCPSLHAPPASRVPRKLQPSPRLRVRLGPENNKQLDPHRDPSDPHGPHPARAQRCDDLARD